MYKMLEDLAFESRMPLCYGGGVKTVEQVKTVIGLGVEKVAISSAAVDNPRLVADAHADLYRHAARHQCQRAQAHQMERLRVSLEGLGFGEVQTYIQSGNVVFKTAKKRICGQTGKEKSPAKFQTILDFPFRC